MILRVLIFLALNFGALAIGGFFTGDGVPSDWYQDLNKAPWTPPGWVFGSAWTLIMICLSLFMAKAYKKVQHKKTLLYLYTIQLILNIAWNPVFFYYHDVTLALLIISMLTILMGYMYIRYQKKLKPWAYLLLPYMIWLCIATSLNGYILIKN